MKHLVTFSTNQPLEASAEFGPLDYNDPAREAGNKLKPVLIANIAGFASKGGF